jgi:uncharacterized protein YigA (DUF484 family)
MDELSRQTGRAEVEFESGGMTLDAGLKLASLYSQQYDGQQRLAELLSKLLEKFSGEFRLQEFILRLFQRAGNREQEKLALEKINEIKPKTIEELRSKAFIYGELKQDEKALQIVLDFEAGNGRTPETC